MTEEEVKRCLGFTQRQSKKDEFMRARAARASIRISRPPNPSKPATIEDARFEHAIGLGPVRCDHCKALKRGNAAGAFWCRKNMPRTSGREAAWRCGAWDATWFCTECYMMYYQCDYAMVCDKLKFTERAAKKRAFKARATSTGWEREPAGKGDTSN